MSLDLNEIDEFHEKINLGEWMKIVHFATGEDTGAELLVAGILSKELSDFFRKIGLESASSKNHQVDNEKIRLDAALIVVNDWRGVQRDGVDVEFSKENLKELLEKAPSIIDQIDAFAANISNYYQQKKSN